MIEFICMWIVALMIWVFIEANVRQGARSHVTEGQVEKMQSWPWVRE
jgi:hypothetical protein